MSTPRTHLSPQKPCAGPGRRDFLKAGVLATAWSGLGLGGLLAGRAASAQPGAQAAVAKSSPAKAVILFWLDGGPTHMETYDPKPDASDEFRGPFGVASTRVPGMFVGELLPRHARLADKLALVRSVHHDNGDHFAAAHWMVTGHHGSTAANQAPMFPSVGAYTARMRGPNREGMPAFVSLPVASTVGLTPGYFSATHLGPAYNPFNAGDARVKADIGLNVTAERLRDRSALLAGFDKLRREVDAPTRSIESGDRFNRQALEMLTTGAARDAFDVSQEPVKMQEFYGKDAWAQYALAARRLVEAGVSFVTCNLNGWDHHSSLEKGMKNVLPKLDRAVGCLLEDLSDRGMLDEVMVVVMGEFGRTPRINKGLPQDPVPGRDHWGNAMSVLMAGGGIRGGAVVGATDARGERPVERPLVPGDVLATIYRQLGIDWQQSFLNPAGRPIPVLAHGNAIEELL